MPDYDLRAVSDTSALTYHLATIRRIPDFLSVPVPKQLTDLYGAKCNKHPGNCLRNTFK